MSSLFDFIFASTLIAICVSLIGIVWYLANLCEKHIPPTAKALKEWTGNERRKRARETTTNPHINT